MTETCTGRRLSWLVKSCLPDPRRDDVSAPLPVVKAAAFSHILSLPDDLLLECLSRVPLSTLRSLPFVCRRFSGLLDSTAFLDLRRSRARLRPTLHALAVSDLGLLTAATLPLDSLAAAWTESPVRLAPADGSLDGSFSHARVVPLGRFLYLIGRGATLRYDAWTGAASPRAPTLFFRRKFAAASLGDRIYVAGGAPRTAAVEEYDPAADTWRVAAEAPRRRYGCVGAAAGGVFYVAGGLRIGGEAGGRMEAHVWAGSMDGLDVEAGSWVARGAARAAAVPGGGCVVGACGAGAHVYVVASHAVELSFWRWTAAGPGRRGGGEWVRLEPPPVPCRAGLGGAVRFSCCAVGESRVAALVHVSHSSGGEAARRGNGRGTDSIEGAVLVYDILRGEWTRGPDLPPGFGRAAIACVDC